MAATPKPKPSSHRRTAKPRPGAGGTTPMLAQYWEIKAQNPDCVLFFRMGDFYEMFFDDAERVAPVLDIALTARGVHDGKPIPMAGVPVHSAEQYLTRLIRAGFRVAVCEQTEDPAEARRRGAKAIVNRAVVRIITAGTLTEDALLDARRNNYLAAVAEVGGELGLGWADISTGETGWQALGAPLATDLANAVARLEPGELLVPDALWQREVLAPVWQEVGERARPLADSRFDSRNAARRLCDHYRIDDPERLGADTARPPTRAQIAALGAVVDYVALTQIGALPHLDRPALPGGEGDGAMVIDAATRANLELHRSLSGEGAGSLLAAIDRTVTAAGGRLLAQRLSAPLTDGTAIGRRLDMVGHYVDAERAGGDLAGRVRALLQRTPDLDRALSRLDLGRGGPRDLAAVRDAIRASSELLRVHEPGAALTRRPRELEAALACFGHDDALADTLAAALADELPLLARDGGFIAAGYAPDLDEARQLRDDSRKLIAGLEARYAELTGVPKLKIKHNNMLGYFIEVTASQAERLQGPDLPFVHRQTLASQMRFTTVELGELVEKITLAQERSLAIELSLFDDLAATVLARREVLSAAARAVAEIDVAAALAVLAMAENYCRPQITDDRRFEVMRGRHPVVEQFVRDAGQPFIANDCRMAAAPGDEDGRRMWLLTGPNMAGKSTFLRQNALIVILAQMGSFVPADTAAIGVVDRVFSRVGAADDLARGRSTFMVEMVETATILQSASARSFVVLDEIGRGTATYDGLSIAWATIEYLHDHNKCRTLFATHYHELTSLAARLDALSCHTMRVKEWRGSVVFLHEVAPGTADRSYGIHVAELAGLPAPVLARAREILARLETSEQSAALRALVSDLPLLQASAAAPAADAGSPLEAALRDLDIDAMTPRQALDALYRLLDLLDE